MDSYLDNHYRLLNKKNIILDELWKLTQKHLDENIAYNIELNQELDFLRELENTDIFKELLKELDFLKNSLNKLYINFLDKECEGNLKKDKIIALKEKFGDKISNTEIVEVVNCSKSYARQFYIIDGIVEQKEKRTHLSKKIKDMVLKRDNNSCIVCDSTEMLEVHHIMPLGGSSIKELNDPENLVTLCANCHYLAHSGDFYKGLAYEDEEDFWKWTKNTEKTRMWLILKDIDGIGIKMTGRVYERFLNIEELENASIRNLKRIKGINGLLAQKIKFKMQSK